MNTKLAFTSITLVAVIMGMGFLTPTLAEKQPKIFVCHFDEGTTDEFGNVIEAPSWIVIHINGNAESAHVGVHTDGTSFDAIVDDSGTVEGSITSQDCTGRNPPPV